MKQKEKLDELVEVFGRHVAEVYANPDRVGCPEQSTLQALADQPSTPQFASIIDHICRCAPCLEELSKLRRQKSKSLRDSPKA